MVLAYGIESRNIKRFGVCADEKRFNWDTSLSKILISDVSITNSENERYNYLQCSPSWGDQLCASWTRMWIIFVSNEENALCRCFWSTFCFSITWVWIEKHDEPVAQDPITTSKDITHRHTFAGQRWKRISQFIHVLACSFDKIWVQKNEKSLSTNLQGFGSTLGPWAHSRERWVEIRKYCVSVRRLLCGHFLFSLSWKHDVIESDAEHLDVGSHCIEKHDTDRVIRTHNYLSLLYLHCCFQSLEHVTNLDILVVGVIAELKHRFRTVNAKQNHISLSFKELDRWGK